ncbi:ATP/GTP-binding protein [Streptomyces sp. C11-1]|uniref:ATP/GTP-binding protein n=1 Tax=Streptomyces durocortorensis TaxID=2811104 RepID=A0ABY9W4L9_9ACTN|nr:ATP/GTP-binding protein [Streptomyces durocortorensis]WNF30978.1 ATP/GTP-binding protein [Streptomyces durocortorensis]
MPSEQFDSAESPHADRTGTGSGRDIALTLKIVVAGGFGAGKTTLVGALSEIRPLRTEELLSESGRDQDDTDGVERKTATTVAMDFGRITIHSGLSLYLFGTPGQDRFWFLWDELCEGALAAVVLADTRRLADCFAAVDYFEHRRIPFVVAVNRFADAPAHTEHDVAHALDLDRGTPVVLCDARDRDSGKDVLIRTVEYAGRMHTARLLDSVG